MSNITNFRANLILINSIKVNQLINEMEKGTELTLKENVGAGVYYVEYMNVQIGHIDNDNSMKIRQHFNVGTKLNCKIVQICGGGMFDYGIMVEFNKKSYFGTNDIYSDEDKIGTYDYDEDGSIEIGGGFNRQGYNREGYDAEGLDEFGYDEDMNGAYDD